jgi:hypothetical protein
MALAEFLKQIDLEELYEGRIHLGSSSSDRSDQDRQTKVQSLADMNTSKIHDTEVSPTESASVPTHQKHSSTTENVISNNPLDFSTNETPNRQRPPSTEIPTRVIEDHTQRRERRLHSLIEEMWSLIPEEKKRGKSRFSRKEKVEIATEHLKSLQERISG